MKRIWQTASKILHYKTRLHGHNCNLKGLGASMKRIDTFTGDCKKIDNETTIKIISIFLQLKDHYQGHMQQ